MGWEEQWEYMVESQRAFCSMTSDQKKCWKRWSLEHLGNTYKGTRPLDRWTGEWIKGTLAKRFMDWWNISLSLSIEITDENIIIETDFEIPDIDQICSYNMSYIRNIPILFDIITPTGDNIINHKEYTHGGGWTEWTLDKRELTSKGGCGTYYVSASWQDMVSYKSFSILPDNAYLITSYPYRIILPRGGSAEVIRIDDLIADKPSKISVFYDSMYSANLIWDANFGSSSGIYIYELENELQGTNGTFRHLLFGYYEWDGSQEFQSGNWSPLYNGWDFAGVNRLYQISIYPYLNQY